MSSHASQTIHSASLPNEYGDLRLSRKKKELETLIASKQSVVIQQLSSDWNQQMSFYRFINNGRIEEAKLIMDICGQCNTSKQIEHVLVCQDTTEINYEHHRKLVKASSGLGIVGNNRDLGYFTHVSLALDAQNGAVLGLSDIQHHIREESAQKAPKQRKQNLLPIEQKETFRWIDGCNKSKQYLKQYTKVTFVQDREGDIYDTFARVPEQGYHLLIRSSFNRNILTKEGLRSSLYEYVAQQNLAGTYLLSVNGESKKRIKREALLDLRYVQVKLLRPDNNRFQRHYPGEIELYLVQAREQPQSVPLGEQPIRWDLLTTHQVNSIDQAIQILKWYKLRWTIEEFFRLLKSEGLQIESSELESGWALRKLGIIAMGSAIKVLQLKQARDGDQTLTLECVFDQDEVTCLEQINASLEGNTQKQKNPHPLKTLPWASWIIARLGGWKGFASQRPPGVIILRLGLERFETLFLGWKLKQDKDVYNR